MTQDRVGQSKSIRKPHSWGVSAADRVRRKLEERWQVLGFDPDATWGLVSLEHYFGKSIDVSRFVDQYWMPETRRTVTKRFKYFFWTWPLPEGDQNLNVDSEITFKMLRLPAGVEVPAELVNLEVIDIHSQIMSRIGFEYLRIHELLEVWNNVAESRQLIAAASMSRNLVEATASAFSYASKVSALWSNCKTTSGEIHVTSTGRTVDRLKALELQNLRDFLWKSRLELSLNDSKKVGLDYRLAEWRHSSWSKLLDHFNLSYRQEITAIPKDVHGETLSQLVRNLSKATQIKCSKETLMSHYELLCNVVHPSIGSFFLHSTSPVSDSLYGFSYTEVGRDRGGRRIGKVNQEDNRELSPYEITGNAISESMYVVGNVFTEILDWLTAISDDMALTAGIEKLTLHRTWRYPNQISEAECLCVWNQLAGECIHLWGSDGPKIKREFEVDLKFSGQRRT